MLESFLQPLIEDDLFSSDQLPGCISNHVRMHLKEFPDLDGVQVAMLAVRDPRLDGVSRGVSFGAEICRTELYRLMKPKEWPVVADIGNVEAGETVEDTLFAFQTVLHELSERNICALVLGGSETLAYYQYQAVKNRSTSLEVSYVGRQINLREGSWMNRLVLDEPNQLFNLSTLGYQSYLTEQESLDAMERMFFDPVRLGTLRARLSLAEPSFRSAHLVVFDSGVLRASEFPAVFDANPNGLLNEEACQLARYAGLSIQLGSVGFYNFNPDYDIDRRGAKQQAQMIWYFLEAYTQRRQEDPKDQGEQFLKYRLALKNTHELVFYKSTYSERWWMEIPHPKSGKENTIPLMIPCEYEDYVQAANDDLPDRWWRFYQKYSV